MRLNLDIEKLNLKLSVIDNDNDFNLLSIELVELYKNKSTFEKNLTNLNKFLEKYNFLDDKIINIIKSIKINLLIWTNRMKKYFRTKDF